MSVAEWKTAYGKTLLVEEREWLKKAAEFVQRRTESPVIVNIGIFRYASMYCLRAGAPRAVIYGIDIKKPDVNPDKELRAKTLIEDSSTYWKELDLEVDLLFIDGDHHYAGVKADIEGWTPKVVVGGIVAFHDYAPTSFHLQKLPMLEGVRRAVSEWQEEAQWDRVKAPGSLVAYRRSGNA